MEEKDAKNWAVFCHIGGIIPIYFLNILIPLVIWLVKKAENPFIEENGREAVNFQISLTIYGLALAAIAFTVIGMPIAVIGFVILVVLNLVCVIRAAIKASNGEKFLYPYNLRLIK